MDGLSLREAEEENNKKLLLINKTKNELINLIENYIENNCVEFKKEEMKKLFEIKISELAEKMSEGKRIVSDGNFSNNQVNNSSSNTKSNISNISNLINNNSNSNASFTLSN